MNTDQLKSFVRSLLKVVGAALATHGATKVAAFINGEDVVGVVMAIIGIWMSHQTHSDDSPNNAVKTPLWVLAPLLAVGLIGCGGAGKLAPGGAYAPLPVVSTNADTGLVTTNQVAADYLLFQADSTFMVAYNIADAAFLLERNNRAFFWKISPDIKHSLDLARPKALATRNAYFKARDVYKANPSALALGVLNLYGSQMQTIQASTDSAMSVVTNSVAPVQ